MPGTDHWGPYAPDEKMPWNLRRVVHLHRRAGFGATWDELQRDLKDGPAASVERLLTGKAGMHSPPEFESTANLLADSAVAAGEIGRLKAWWHFRFLFGPDPLGEKLTLLWHDHFATAHSKVQDVGLMRRQNDTLRANARGKFSALLNATVREPALLFYLDAQTNRKGHANENLGRELMELFTLGVGNYSETDVKEAARALTGWTVEDGQFAEAAARHDGGDKTILGKTGNWKGADLLGILLVHPATSERIAMKLCRQFFGESGVAVEAQKALAAGLRDHDLDILWAVGTIFKSKVFFADTNLGNRVQGPVEFVVGAARALGMFDPAPSTLALADWAGRIGQDVFDPPNVGGWPPGRAWIHTRAMIARANYAAALIGGANVGRGSAYDAAAAAKRHGFGSDPAAALTFHHRLRFGTDPSDAVRQKVADAPGGKMVAVLLAMPEAQLA